MVISVILVNYNGRMYNQSCIRSVFDSRCDAETQIIVVDNGSTDGSLDELTAIGQQDERVEVISLHENLGFAAANNVGIKEAAGSGADYILLLNNDTIVHRNMLQALLTCEQRHRGSVITPKIYYADDTNKIWAAGGRLSGYIKKAVQIGENEPDRGQYEEEKQVDFSTGCCMFFSTELLKTIGYLDESFFLYYEDVEWCLRMGKTGVSIYYCPAAVLYHKVNASTKGNDNPLCAYYIARNWLICNRMYLGNRFYLFAVYYMLNRLAWIGIWGLQGKKGMIKATRRAIADYRRGATGICRERFDE